MARYYSRVQGVATVKLSERLLLLSASACKVPQRKFKTYPGSTTGDIIGPVIMPSSSWEITWAEKKLLYGAQNLIGVGGKMETPNVEKQRPPRTNYAMEPAFYHSYPVEFYLELLEAFPCKAIIDLTPGEGNLAMAAFQLNIMYLGFPFNTKHESMLLEHLDKDMMQALLTEGSPLYSAELHSLLMGAGVPASSSGLQGRARASGGRKGRGSRGSRGRGRGRGSNGRGRGRGRGTCDDEDIGEESGEGTGEGGDDEPKEDDFTGDEGEGGRGMRPKGRIIPDAPGTLSTCAHGEKGV